MSDAEGQAGRCARAVGVAVIEALVAGVIAELARRAPGALVAVLRELGILPDSMTDDDASDRLQRAADILGDVNPMRQIRRRVVIPPPPPVPFPPPANAPEYEAPDTEPPDAA